MYDYAYYREVFRGQTLPFAYLDLNLLEQNIDQIRSNAGSKLVRLASKSLRSIAVLRRILEAAECFQGLMCFTAREAVYLASQGFDDLLIGYPAWHEDDIAAVAQAVAAGSHITFMIDSLAHIEQVERVACRQQVRLPLCLDLDMAQDLPGLHFGVWRSSLRTTEQVRPLLEHIAASTHVWLDGVMGYEAQIAGVGDQYPGQAAKNLLVRFLKQRSMQAILERRAAIIELIKSYAIQLRFVNGGGTGSLLRTREDPTVTEITVGSGFYAPALFDNYRDFRYRPAAGFAIEIVRRPQQHIFTCLGGGYVASGTASFDKLPQPYLPMGARLEAMEGAGEVQTPIRYAGSEALHCGDPIFLRHSKAGELCERFSHLLLVADGKVVDKVPTYRGDGQCFL
ncbi:amino acid deaminase/aldolase [Ktedonosporobacter rubrisoli]|uniref:Amino acid deaminase/aldolase n=1 Tax=Ktedonosporobacter rubrisoli TaxID=2509675 RepID=A0A4P6K688_KTERU|nr:amino acid deaminase/aldolase [Ktedonosporobacter rubrisoli]